MTSIDRIGSLDLPETSDIKQSTPENPVQEYVVEEKVPVDPTWIIITTGLIILLIAWIILIFLAIDSIPQIYAEGNGTVLIQCPTDQCATNRYNGEKRCPPPGQQIASNAGIEFCSSATICDNDDFPYAVLSDQSTDALGQCEPTATCRCLAKPRCAQYIMSKFETNLGNPYISLEGQRTSFVQNISSTAIVVDAEGDQLVFDNPPLTYETDGLTFCTIPIDWILRSTPGCGFMQVITPGSITTCMGGPLNCNPDISTFNPCSRGTLAFVTDNSDDFNAESIELIPMACVAGEPCACGNVAVFDTRSESIICKNIL